MILIRQSGLLPLRRPSLTQGNRRILPKWSNTGLSVLSRLRRENIPNSIHVETSLSLRPPASEECLMMSREFIGVRRRPYRGPSMRAGAVGRTDIVGASW